MKKYFKYILVSILSFVLLIGSAYATTIKETTINGDGYDTIESGTNIIGVTKFASEVTITGAKAAKAGSNDAVVYSKLNGSLEDYESPKIYVYQGVGGWYVLDEDNKSSVVEDEATLRRLSNLDIYYINNIEKKLEVDVTGLDIDTDNLPKGVTKEGNKLLVNATVDSFEIATNDGKKVSFVKENGEFIENQSMCYTVSNGYITDYDSTCSSNVKIPSNINGEEIIGVRRATFKGMGIKNVEIPASVMHLEEEAFKNNELESVIIYGKYDQNDFITYGASVFGDFTNITYKNDLTDLLDLFNDEVEIKVSQTAYDKIMDQDPHAIPFYMETSELNRLGLTEENGLTNGKYFIAFMYNDQLNDLPFPWNYEKIILKIDDVTNNKSVQKEVTYDLNIVNSSDNKYLNIESEYESYYNNLKQNYKNNLNSSITGIDKFYEIVDSYEYSAEIIGSGEVPPSKLNEDLNIIDGGAECALIYNGILEDIYDMTFISRLYYKITGEGTYSTINNMLDAYIDEFENETGITNYELTWKENNDNAPSTAATDYSVSIEDSNDNFWTIGINYKSLLGTYKSASGKCFDSNEICTINTYIPTKSLEDFGDTQDFRGNIGNYYDEIAKQLSEVSGYELCPGGHREVGERCLSLSLYNTASGNMHEYFEVRGYAGTLNSDGTGLDTVWKVIFDKIVERPWDDYEMTYATSCTSCEWGHINNVSQINPELYDNVIDYIKDATAQFARQHNISSYLVNSGRNYYESNYTACKSSDGTMHTGTCGANEDKYYSVIVWNMRYFFSYRLYIPYKNFDN